MRELLLRHLYRAFPFPLAGDFPGYDDPVSKTVTCIINFYGRVHLLEGILWSLATQDFPKGQFEVVLIEDRGGTEEGRAVCNRFSDLLTVRYYPLQKNFGRMGFSRNFGLTKARGKYVLLLDDDTVLLQADFLQNLSRLFAEQADADAIMPKGNAAFALIEDRYDFHDPFFMTSRCMVYRRETLLELSGFMNHFIGQEDVEFVLRFTIAQKRALKAGMLEYFHPPLLVPHPGKPRAVGASFFALKNRYSWPVWLLSVLNGCRHLPLAVLPFCRRQYREQSRFGYGFLLGILDGIRGSCIQGYQ